MLAWVALVIAGAIAVQADTGSISAAASTKAPTATVYVQAMDSCKQALGGGAPSPEALAAPGCLG